MSGNVGQHVPQGESTERAAEKHAVTVIINGQSHEVATKQLSFDETVALAYDGSLPSGPNWVFTVGYRRGEGQKPDGSLVKGGVVKVKDGMIFNVTATDKS